MVNHLNHEATGDIQLVYLQNETVSIKADFSIDSEGKISNVLGMAQLYVNAGQQEFDIPLEWDPFKQKFFYFVDEDGNVWDDWAYREEEEYQKLLRDLSKNDHNSSKHKSITLFNHYGVGII